MYKVVLKQDGKQAADVNLYNDGDLDKAIQLMSKDTESITVDISKEVIVKDNAKKRSKMVPIAVVTIKFHPQNIKKFMLPDIGVPPPTNETAWQRRMREAKKNKK